MKKELLKKGDYINIPKEKFEIAVIKFGNPTNNKDLEVACKTQYGPLATGISVFSGVGSNTSTIKQE